MQTRTRFRRIISIATRIWFQISKDSLAPLVSMTSISLMTLSLGQVEIKILTMRIAFMEQLKIMQNPSMDKRWSRILRAVNWIIGHLIISLIWEFQVMFNQCMVIPQMTWPLLVDRLSITLCLRILLHLIVCSLKRKEAA